MLLVSKNCLFCGLSESDDNISGAENVIIKREPRDFIVSSSHEDYHFENQLKSVFILRNLLEISEEQCGKYLQQNEGSRNPSTWFCLCSKCSDVIEECHQIYREVLSWKRKLDKKKEWLKIKIEESRGMKWEQVSVNLDTLFRSEEHIKKTSHKLSPLLLGEESIKDSPQSQSRRSTRIRKQVTTTYREEDDVPEEISLPASPACLFSEFDENSRGSSDDSWCPSDIEIPQTVDTIINYSQQKCRNLPNKRIKKHKKKSSSIAEEQVEEGIPFYCDHCPMTYTTVSFLHYHCVRAHVKKDDKLNCTFCERVFNSSQLLDLHHLEAHSHEEMVLRLERLESIETSRNCPHCSEIFHTKLEFDFHIAKLHQDVFLRCPVCKFRATELWELQTHFQSTNHNVGLIINCTICGKHQNKNAYWFHMRAIHFQNISEPKLNENMDCSTNEKSRADFDCDEVIGNFHLGPPKTPSLPSLHSSRENLLSVQEEIEFTSEGPLKVETLEDSLVEQSSTIIGKRGKRIEKSRKKSKRNVKLGAVEKAIKNLNGEGNHESDDVDPLSNKDEVSKTKRHKFKCSECVASYSSRRRLLIHSKVHKLPPGILASCGKCGWAFKFTVKSGHRHRVSQCPNPGRKFQCKLCGTQFVNKKRYTNHVALHETETPGNKNLTCVKCGILVKSRKTMKQHMAMHARVDFGASSGRSKRKMGESESLKEMEIPYYCDHCHLIFPSNCFLRRHVRLGHTDMPLAECELCNSTKFESKQLLQMHNKLVHGVSDTGSSNLAHLETSAIVSDEPISASCNHCPETFSTKMKLDYHIAKCHWKTQLTCPTCKKLFRDFTGLKSHMSTHEASHTTMCEICSKAIKRGALKSHMRVFHYKELGVEAIQCQECKKIFSTTGNLKKHMDFVHLHNVANSCHLCPKKFLWQRDLELHIQAHLEPKKHKYKKGPFFCKICQAKFNVRQGLYYHMKRLHSDKFLFRCENCGKGYCFENALLQHRNSCKEMAPNFKAEDVLR